MAGAVGMRGLAAVAASGGGGAPANPYGLTYQWDGGEGVDTGSSNWWTDRIGGVAWQQATATSRPTYTAADPDWNNEGSLLYDGNDFGRVDETVWSRADQAVLHNVTQDIFGFVVFETGNGSNNSPLLNNQASATLAAGFNLTVRPSFQTTSCSIYNGSAQAGINITDASLADDVKHVSMWIVDTAAQQLRYRLDGGTWQTQSLSSFTPHAGDSGRPITTGAYGDGSNPVAGCRVTNIGIRIGSIPSTAMQDDILAAMNARYAI